MALGNYLFSGSYTNISSIVIDHAFVTINLSIWSDSNKTTLFAGRAMSVDKNVEMWTTDSMTEIDCPPETVVPDRIYFISNTPTGEFANMPYPSYARFNSIFNCWDKWTIRGELGPIRCLGDGKKYMKKSDGTTRYCNDQFDKVDYDTWFSYSVLDAQGVNHTSQAYLMLKTLPEFANCTDV